MKLNDLKYGFLISASTLFGGSTLSLYAQESNGTQHKVETVSNYKQQFLESISADKTKLNIDFMVDSVKQMTSHGDLVGDVNVIELLAYLEPDSDEYQSYLANKHVVAHEMWHRICLMKGVLEQPMSATQFRTGQDNFEITASLLSVLTFRDDYVHATPKEREALAKSVDPKIQMYVQAIKHDIVRPLSQDKKDFDFEMKFIAVMVSNFWNNNMAESYSQYHNVLTLKSGRKEFNSPVYEKNFNHDIKVMNTIGGIDFSKYYKVKGTQNTAGLFPVGNKPDNVVLKRSLEKPDYETWINKKSKLKRYSKQRVEIPNFAGNILVKERQSRPLDQRVQPYTIVASTSGYKNFPKANVLFKTAIELKKQDKLYKFYPNGSLDEISPTKTAGVCDIVTYNIDGSVEKGQLYQNRKNGVFTYYDANKKQIGSCTFKNGRPQNGVMLGVFNKKRFFYSYQNGRLVNIGCKTFDGKNLSSCTMNNDKPTTGLMPKDTRFSDMIFEVYENGEKLASVALDDHAHMTDRLSEKGKTIKIEKFYTSGTPRYAAKITPFKEMEVLYDEKAKPVILRSKVNQKMFIKGNLFGLRQEVQKSPLAPEDKKIVFFRFIDLLKQRTLQKGDIKKSILFDNPFMLGNENRSIPDVFSLSSQIKGKITVKQDNSAVVKESLMQEIRNMSVQPVDKTFQQNSPKVYEPRIMDSLAHDERTMAHDERTMAHDERAMAHDERAMAKTAPQILPLSEFFRKSIVSHDTKPLFTACSGLPNHNKEPAVCKNVMSPQTISRDKGANVLKIDDKVAFHPVCDDMTATIKLAHLTTDVSPKNQNATIVTGKEQDGSKASLCRQDVIASDADRNLAQNTRAPKFLWRRFSFSPHALTNSANEQGGRLTLMLPRICASIKSLRDFQNKKAMRLKMSRFQNRLKLPSSKKIMNLLKTRYLTGRRRGSL